jgi:hypothetical protein
VTASIYATPCITSADEEQLRILGCPQFVGDLLCLLRFWHSQTHKFRVFFGGEEDDTHISTYMCVDFNVVGAVGCKSGPTSVDFLQDDATPVLSLDLFHLPTNVRLNVQASLHYPSAFLLAQY